MANDDNRHDRKGRWEGLGFGGGGRSGQGGRNPWRFSILYIIGAIILLFLIRGVATPGPTSQTLNVFNNQLKAGQVKEVNISSDAITWTTKTNQQNKATLPPNYDPTALVTQLQAQNVPVTGEQPSQLLGFLFQWIIPFALLIGLYVFVMRRLAGGGAANALNLGKNRVKIYDRKEMKTTFADVAGVDEAVDELREIVEFLRTPKKYQRLGGRIPKGVLLLGPPGCGKTLLARAVAGEAGVPFFFMSGSEFVEMFVGLGGSGAGPARAVRPPGRGGPAGPPGARGHPEGAHPGGGAGQDG